MSWYMFWESAVKNPKRDTSVSDSSMVDLLPYLSARNPQVGEPISILTKFIDSVVAFALSEIPHAFFNASVTKEMNPVSTMR